MITEIFGKKFNLPYLYQPVWEPEQSEPPGRHDCAERLATILEADRIYDYKSLKDRAIVDWGANLGWFLCEMEHGGIGKRWDGVENCKEFLEVSGWIAGKQNKKAGFGEPFMSYVDIPTTLLVLSASHQIENFETQLGTILKEHQNIQTVYIEQATPLEYPTWAERLKPPIHAVPAFWWRDHYEKVTGGQFVCRLVGTSRTHLNTVRYFYMLKRKIREELNIYGKFQDHYTIEEKWNYPHLQSVSAPEGTREYYRTACGKFIKKKVVTGNENYFVEPWIEGLVLPEALRFGLFPWLNREQIRKDIKQIYTEMHDGKKMMRDFRPHNIMVDEQSRVHLIDKKHAWPEGMPVQPEGHE